MKTNFFTLLLISLGLFLTTSCIKEEGQFREADILEFTINDTLLLTTIYNEHTREISLVMNDTTGFFNAKILPTISVSQNAKIYPAIGDSVKLDGYSKIYTITAEDGAQKVYLINLVQYVPTNIDIDFEEWYTVSYSAQKIYDMPSNLLWTNANAGVAILYRNNERFPTRSIADARPGSTGVTSVVLTTASGNFSNADIMNIPVYAGNMYCGTFNSAVAMLNPLGATKFGQLHPKYAGKPLMLKAWYKYKPGSEYTTWEYKLKEDGSGDPATPKKKVITTTTLIVDKPDLYAIVYKVTKGIAGKNEFLTAKDIKTSDKIVATAFLKDHSLQENWKKLEIAFEYTEELNYDKYDYKIAIVLSSSSDGANYKGAIGSELIVDDLTIECQKGIEK